MKNISAYDTAAPRDWGPRLEQRLIGLNEAPVDERHVFEELNPGVTDRPLKYNRIREAAVLVPIIDRPAGPTVLFTVRSPDMPSHAGQISFPGGMVQNEDATHIDGALREAEEEVGVAPALVAPIGRLQTHIGGMGFAVTPVVARIDPGAMFTPDPREVADIFEAPLDFLLDSSNHKIVEKSFGDTAYRFHAVPYKDWHIWGLTATMVRSLAEIMEKEA